MVTATTTAPAILELATVRLAFDVDTCGCIMTADRFFPCEACKAEVHADLVDVYGDGGDDEL